MPSLTPVPTKAPGDILTSSLWNSYLRDNINKLLDRGHRVLTVAQFSALTSPEGTKGTTAPDEVYLEVDSTNGIQWHLAYESGEVTYKWRFLGGPPLYSEVATAETTASTGYAALGTAGPSIAVPRAGDYDVDTGVRVSSVSAAINVFFSYDIGASAAVDTDSIQSLGSADTARANFMRKRRKAALTSVTLTGKYRVGSGTGGFADRWMAIRPVRVRHDA